MLYLVATPIGNLEDITLRALRVLREVSLIAAEDTRHTGKLLKHYEIDTPLISYHEFSAAGRIAQLVERLRAGDVALVSDAGMPGLSDPGYRLVNAALEAGIEVTPIPGASAAVPALVSSGLPTDQFLFVGFLPRQQSARRKGLAELAKQRATLVLYESPQRLLGLLADIEKEWGNRQLAVCRELTKLHEEIWRGDVSGAQAHFGAGKVRGELTLVVAGAEAAEEVWDAAAVRAALAAELAAGATKRDAVEAVVAASGWRKKPVYALALEIG